jgi:hypothetical protein
MRRARRKARRPVSPAAGGPARGGALNLLRAHVQSSPNTQEASKQDHDPTTNPIDPLAFLILDPGQSTRGRGTRRRSRTLQLWLGPYRSK